MRLSPHTRRFIESELFKMDLKEGKADTESEQALIEADRNLKEWAKGEIFHNRKEIKKDCGVNTDTALGVQYKRSGAYNRIYDDYLNLNTDTRFRALNAVYLKMSAVSRKAVSDHYVERQGRKLEEFLPTLRVRKQTYLQRLKQAKKEFIDNGGLFE